ncbi:phospholipase A and acyltransferase 3-like [Heteronotia binoei]|uniref:phospholipase A and acyltransferase 3-like n=1 Tax=Heteronotia binoei TaxID=13085 RepID=UPI00292DD3C7|nr:phospholipase A and acyltransferase 3-like [Heteronotia binoei]
MSWRPEMKPKPGDLIEIERSCYQHWAIYIGDGYVVHLAPESEVAGAGFGSLLSITTDRAVVRKDPLLKVVGNDKYKINNKYDGRYLPLPVYEIISRAKAEVGRVMPYNVLSENCEHFVTNLRYGNPVSDQVRDGVMKTIGASLAVIGIVAVASMINKSFVRKHQNE